MVLTRSQASKSKAQDSPADSPAKLTKQPRQQRAGAARATGSPAPAGPGAKQQQQQPLGDRQLNIGIMGLKLAKLKAGPASHPIDSLPASPAAALGVEVPFTIAAVQQQRQQQELGQALAVAAAAQAAGEQQQQQEQQPPAREATSVEKKQQAAAEEQEEAAAKQQLAAAAPEPAVAPVEQQAAAPPQQQAQPPPPQLRPEKLLKRLPDTIIPCDKLPDGPEPVAVEVEYVAREDLQPVEDTGAALALAVPGMEAGDWLEVVRALNLLRQLVVRHPDACSSQLGVLVPLVIKSVRSLRSSVCKTAIMAVADLYLTFGAALLPHTDVGGQLKPLTSLLAQMLLKCSSNDKKFVIEEAQAAMQIMVASLPPADILGLLLPYADLHKNPKVRGKAGSAATEAVARMVPAELAAFGLPRLLAVSGKLVTDNTPDARDSAKRIINQLKASVSDPAVEAQLSLEVPPPVAPAAEGEEAPLQPTKWEFYCRSNLSGSAALAVLKACSE